jgi:hypothetical protein
MSDPAKSPVNTRKSSFSQHDFGEVDVTFLDGSSRRIHFFASRLKYSRFIRVSVVKDQAVESLVRSVAEHLDSLGGAPLMCVFDRPKNRPKTSRSLHSSSKAVEQGSRRCPKGSSYAYRCQRYPWNEYTVRANYSKSFLALAESIRPARFDDLPRAHHLVLRWR